MFFKSITFAYLISCSSLLFSSIAPSFSQYPPMSVVYHPVSTSIPEAQRAFNRGLLGIYAFNHDEAYICFKKAAELDPNLAMAYWGMALAIGENINTPITFEREKQAYELMQMALSLSKQATLNEQAYIEALSTRYSTNKNMNKESLRRAYADAMRKLMQNYPDDLDAATLYAESLMDLRPWKLWKVNGEPAEDTLEIINLIKHVLKQNPMHLGANHYFIHAVEASKHPEEGLISAYRLYNQLLPEWGHIIHMPSHIFILVGDYENAVLANQRAVEADEEYIRKSDHLDYYPLHYMSHNLFFLCRSYMWQDRYNLAIETAEKLSHFLSPHIKSMPELEYYLLAPLQVRLYFHQWEEILQINDFQKELKGCKAFRSFARAMAFASLGHFDDAKKEEKNFIHLTSLIHDGENLGYNSARDVLNLASDLLSATLLKQENKLNEAVQYLLNAVKKQDKLNYNEPPDWYYPIRQTLGATYIKMNNLESAEDTFRKALERLPRNGRSLFGLLETLKRQNKFDYWIEREAKEALRYSENHLSLEKL